MNKQPQIPLDLSPKPRHLFSNLLISGSNAAAVKTLRAWPDWPSPVLLLIGPQGSGKTHMGQAWAAEYKGIFIDSASSVDEAELFSIMNQALNGEVMGVLLADRLLPGEWDIKMPDLVSRLKNTPHITVEEPDDDILEPIIRRLFEDQGRVVSQDLIAYLLKYHERSVSAQREIVMALEAAAQGQKVDLTKAFAAKFLKARSEGDLFAVPSEE
ncbi:hypothetical protein N9M10_05720 [Hellea sp.]|nr:hypothetical protein [Hellea sp.]